MTLNFKICGINSKQNLKELLSLKPNFIGHIFFLNSARNLPLAELGKFQEIDYQETNKVAVLVNPEISLIKSLLEEFQFQYFQLHGDETAAFCQEVKLLSSKIIIIKAVSVGKDFKQEELEAYLPFVDYFLFDTKTQFYGGSGKSFNWDLLKDYSLEKPYLLSGGLNPKNIEAAKAFATSQPRCYGLDLNSGFEISPGLKSIELLKEIL